MTATVLPIATEPRVWSYSSLNQLLRVCSLQFYFERVERLEPEQGSAAAALGTAIHYAAGLARRQQAAGRLDRAEVRGVFLDALMMSLDTGLPLVFPKNADAASLRELGLKLVDVLLDDVTACTDEVVAVERDFQVPITLPDGSVRQVTGALDLVVREEDGVLTVTDLKTASSAYSPVRVDNDLQATIYSYAAEQLYGEQVRVRFDVLVNTGLVARGDLALGGVGQDCSHRYDARRFARLSRGKHETTEDWSSPGICVVLAPRGTPKGRRIVSCLGSNVTVGPPW